MNKRSLKWTGLLAAVFAAVLPQTAFAQQQWSIGFWAGANGVPISSLDWGGLTHISHIGVQPRADGSVEYLCAWSVCNASQFSSVAANVIGAAHAHNVKVLLNLNNVPGSLYSGAISGDASRFANNIMDVVNTYGYDGVDLDWENSINWGQMQALVSTLRNSLGGKALTVDAVTNDAARWGPLAGYLDRVNIMTYDMAGTWNPYSWFNSALYGDSCDCVWSVELAVRRMKEAGVPAGKIGIGLPFYGWGSSGGGVVGPRQAWGGALPSLSQRNYDQLAASYNLSSPRWDSTAHEPWISTGNGWVTFDNERSITDKINYAKSNNLGGWIIWALEQDYMPSQTLQHPLLTAVKEAIGATSNPTPDPTPTPTPTPTPNPSPSTSAPVANGTYTIKSALSGMVLDDPFSSVQAGTQIIQWPSNGGNNQKWQVNFDGNGYYAIKNAHSGEYLTDTGGKLVQALQTNNASQLWSLKANNGGYMLVNKGTGKVVDDPYSSRAEGTGIITFTANGQANQTWTIQ